jgi:hypothetical protein
MAQQITITKQELKSILEEMRNKNTNRKKTEGSCYREGNDVQSIDDVYMKTIKVSGEKLNNVDQSRMLVVKYSNTNDEQITLNLTIQLVKKHIPRIAMMKINV